MRARPRLAWPDPVPAALSAPPFAGAIYADRLQQLIVAYKEQGRFGLATPLGRMLADVLEQICAAIDPGSAGVGLVPVPSRRDAVRRRGHDHVLRLARVSAGLLRGRGRDVTVEPLLRHARSVADQAGLPALDRARNLEGALCVRSASPGRLQGRALIVVDDVITTGASAAEAVTTLRRAGHLAVAVATIAATPRRWPSTGTHG